MPRKNQTPSHAALKAASVLPRHKAVAGCITAAHAGRVKSCGSVMTIPATVLWTIAGAPPIRKCCAKCITAAHAVMLEPGANIQLERIALTVAASIEHDHPRFR